MHVRNVPPVFIQVELHVKHVRQSPDVQHVPKQRRHVPPVRVDIIYQVEHVRCVRVRSPIVPYVHQPQHVPHVLQDIIHQDRHVHYVPVRNVLLVMHPVESVQLVNQDII